MRNNIINPAFWLDGSVLNVRLPAGEVFIATLDNDKPCIFECKDGILDIAQQNAESYLTRLFLAFGYSDVIFAAPNP